MPKVSVGRAELDTRNFVLYRYYDRAGVLLYVGITVDLRARETKHSKHSAWWQKVDHEATVLERYIGERAVRAAETAAIKAEKPLENDQHNEFVEVETAEGSADEALALADEILGDMDDEFSADLLESCATDWQGEPLSERQQRIAAAGMAAFRIRSIHRDLLYNLDQLLDLLPDERGQNYKDVARGQLPPGSSDEADWWDMKFIPVAVDLWLLDEASLQLDAMPDEEAREWRNTIISKTIGPSRRTILAARHASIWKQYGVTFAGRCTGPGRHGARCASETSAWTFFEICSACHPEPECAGHDHWCLKHAQAAQRGDLEIVADDRWGRALQPISRVRPMNLKPVEPAF